MAEAKKKATKKAKVVKEAEPVEETAVVPEPVEETTEAKAEEPVAIAKAGKHSAKALKEAEEKQAKQERKASKTEVKAEEAKKAAKKPPRSRAERAGKKYREVAKLVDNNKTYELKEALEIICKTSPTKFDSTVEIHVNLNVDPTQSDQNVRGTVVLPSGSGKKLRIAVLTEDDTEQILPKLDKEDIDFDILITTPAMMPKLGKYARLLGPRGLMPNPKSGTVTTDVAKAVEEAKAGRVEYRVDQAGIVHAGIGKVSFGEEKLLKNLEAMLASLRAAKPASIKSAFIKSIYLTTTMGPSVKISTENS
jgi:large subunit ribosomal protein L1